MKVPSRQRVVASQKNSDHLKNFLFWFKKFSNGKSLHKNAVKKQLSRLCLRRGVQITVFEISFPALFALRRKAFGVALF